MTFHQISMWKNPTQALVELVLWDQRIDYKEIWYLGRGGGGEAGPNEKVL